ncbi:MAG: hypothetical protein ABIP55_15955 [Tepidisphaeraceae bacterium]
MFDVRCSFFLSVLIGFLVQSGCHPAAPTLPPSPTEPPKMSASKTALERGLAAMTGSVASAAQEPIGMRVDIYVLQVPQGTVSRNDEFWKRIDEHAVDVSTYDLLYKNGVRIGQGHAREWDHFRRVMDEYPAVTKSTSLVSVESKPVELPLRKDVTAQDICYFDAGNVLHGQSFDACENYLTITLQPAPRKPGTMRLALCPTVRSVRKRLQFSPLNHEQEVLFTAPEKLYNLNLSCDVPLDHFLVIAPSSEATWRTSVGNTFFITEGPAEKLENVLLVVPRLMRIEQVPNPR